MKRYFKKQFWIENPKKRKVFGITLVIIGLLSVITPFTPIGFLLILGIEMLGLRALFWERLKRWVNRIAER